MTEDGCNRQIRRGPIVQNQILMQKSYNKPHGGSKVASITEWAIEEKKVRNELW